MKQTRSRVTDNLWVRPGTSALWFSLSVPKRFQATEGRKVIQFSLKTSDLREARRLAARHKVDLERRWYADAGCAEPAKAARVGELALGIHEELLERLESFRRERPMDDCDQDAEIAKRESELRRLTRRAVDGDMAPWEAMADRMIANGDLAIQQDSTAYGEFVKALCDASIDALSVFTRRHSGDLDAAVRSQTMVAERRRQAEKAKPGETLLELFDRYAEQRKAENGKRDDTLTQDRKVIEQFAEFVGADRSVASIKPEHVREYRDTMRQLPPKWRERTDLRGRTMLEAAKVARARDMPRVTLTTINKHLSTISPLFAWLIEERWDFANPCTGLFFKRVKGKNPRPPLGTDTLNAILESPLFTGFQGDGKEHLPGNSHAGDWRRWIPLLCLFTGMRVGEAAQLRTEDVSQHESGAWVIDIRHDPAKGQTTKAGQSRATVAHSKLVELGFAAFVERRRGASDSRLFPELVANDRMQIGAEPSEFWRDYLTRVGIKTGRDGLGAHSFRHELADRLREEVGLVDDQIAVALGHDQKSTTAGYGAVRQGTVKFLASVIEQVRFDGVRFDHLIAPDETGSCPDLPAEKLTDRLGPIVHGDSCADA